MFSAQTYMQRRKRLTESVDSGLLVFLGNNESPINYPDNGYKYRQDSSFVYFWGIDHPGLAAAIDLEDDSATLYGDDLTIDEIVWMGPQPLLGEKAEQVGVQKTAPSRQLETDLRAAAKLGKKVHFLPQYRGDNMIKLAEILDVTASDLNQQRSEEFVRAVMGERLVKSAEEITEMEIALDISHEMHTFAMRKTRPGILEQVIAGGMEGIALARGGYVAYPVIFSVHGETLHNHYHGNLMQAGDIAVNDSGAAAASHYASDITRTIPVSGKFTERQKEIYQIVLDAMESGIRKVAPGVKFKEIHLHCCEILVEGLKGLGLMRGDVQEAVAAGAHALFFQCGTGHMLGLDVHDMEDLGEDLLGYDAETSRSKQFGLSYLRLGRRLHSSWVVTVEPGIYLIPELIDMWKSENKLEQFINYDVVAQYRHFGGVRVEENVVVTDNGYRILGKPIPKTIAEVEEACGR